jgi:hypothetical protein
MEAAGMHVVLPKATPLGLRATISAQVFAELLRLSAFANNC